MTTGGSPAAGIAAWRPVAPAPGRSPDARGEVEVRGSESWDTSDPRGWDADTAVTVLYTAHWSQLVRLASLLTRDASVAEEIVQDAFVALHSRWRRLADPAAARGYLRTSVVNACRSQLRHRDVEERHRQPSDPAPAGPEERAIRGFEDARVLAALRRLPARQQEVLVLRYYAELSELEIAETMRVSRGAVKSHAHRGLAALRSALEDRGVAS